MAGPRLDRTSDRARRFAQELIESASAQARAWQSSRLGPFGLRVGTHSDDDFSRLVLGAFLSGTHVPPTFSLAIARHGEPARLPPTLWAQPWIESATPIPVELSHRYRVFLDRQVGIAYAFDRHSRAGAVWVRRRRELDLRSFITPFRVMLSWMAATEEAEILHASAAVVDGSAIAFSGASGSGKSTLAIGLGLAGHQFISDDCLLMSGERVHAVFARAKLDDAAVRLVGADSLDLQSLPDTPRAKRFVSVADLGPRFIGEHPLHALGFPILGLGVGHYPMPQRRAYRMLAADSLREIFGGTPRNRLRLARAARRYPAVRILLGASMAQNAETVRAAIDAVAPQDREALAVAVRHG